MAKSKLPKDSNERAVQIAMMATGEIEKETPQDEAKKAAATLGRLGGLKGGAARAAKLTTEQRKKIAQDAAAKRWSKK